ncbi:mechanosensitive ion channel family protein [Psychrobacter arenosus]
MMTMGKSKELAASAYQERMAKNHSDRGHCLNLEPSSHSESSLYADSLHHLGSSHDLGRNHYLQPIYALIVIVLTAISIGLPSKAMATEQADRASQAVLIDGRQATNRTQSPSQAVLSDSDHETGAKEAVSPPKTINDTPDNFGDYVAQQAHKTEQKIQRELNGTEPDDEVGEELSKTAAALGESNREQTYNLQADPSLTGEYNEAYYVLSELNAGLPVLERPVNLQTPLSTLEFFQTATLQKKFALASYALNMNLIDKKLQSSKGVELVRKLDFLLSEKELYLFDTIPDRADGLVEPPLGSSSSIDGIPRRSIKLGYIDYDSRRVPIFLERVRVDEGSPIWVFSAQTVENIEMLYDQHKPAEFAKYLPEWLTTRFFGIAIWEYLALVFFFTITLGLGWLLSSAAGKLINWYADDKEVDNPIRTRKDGLPDLVNKLIVPLTFTISFTLVFALVSGAYPYIDAVASSTRAIVWIGLVIVTLWLGIRTINFFANRYQDLQIDSLDEEQFHTERRHRTYLSIFRRIFIFAMILGGFWIGLSEFTNIEGLGKTLLTSAGIAGAVIGIAAQPILGNIIAGVLVAVTQPVRIGDTVILDGDWATIEDLGYTYAVLLTWDERRLIVPMRYFVTEVLENWSHTDVHQTCVVYLYVDYGADTAQIRDKFIRVVKDHELWDGETEPVLLVHSVTEWTIKLRGTVASSNPNDAFALECAVRETMLHYLNTEQGAYLPTERITVKSPEARRDAATNNAEATANASKDNHNSQTSLKY